MRMSAEGQRRKEATKARMGMARVPPAMTNMFSTSRSMLLFTARPHLPAVREGPEVKHQRH